MGAKITFAYIFYILFEIFIPKSSNDFIYESFNFVIRTEI
jgi:hypothetical protein